MQHAEFGLTCVVRKRERGGGGGEREREREREREIRKEKKTKEKEKQRKSNHKEDSKTPLTKSRAHLRLTACPLVLLSVRWSLSTVGLFILIARVSVL